MNRPMRKSAAPALLLCFFCYAVSLLRCTSASPLPTSPQDPTATPFLDALQSRCPLSFSPSSPIEVGGDFLDRALSSKSGNAYSSILFYASWCPFSYKARLTFEILSSMFPQVEHLAVEQSSALPSIFSRYGIHSLPTILVVNRTSRMRFRGTKDLHSLVKFYKMATGHEPVHYVAMEQPISPRNSEKVVLQSWIGISPKEILRRELYLVLSALFVALRLFAYLLPKVLSRFKAFWVSYGPHLNMEIFGETSQMLGRVLQMVDVTRVWTKLSIVCKIRNLHQGAKNTRVWASSLASVSLGGTS